MDIIDVLLQVGIFATFIIFGLVVFAIKVIQMKEKAKKEKDQDKTN